MNRIQTTATVLFLTSQEHPPPWRHGTSSRLSKRGMMHNSRQTPHATTSIPFPKVPTSSSTPDIVKMLQPDLACYAEDHRGGSIASPRPTSAPSASAKAAGSMSWTARSAPRTLSLLRCAFDTRNAHQVALIVASPMWSTAAWQFAEPDSAGCRWLDGWLPSEVC